MISAQHIELIEIHADRHAKDVARDLMTNARTPAFRQVRSEDLERRIFQILHDLGTWIGEPKNARVAVEFSPDGPQ